MELLGKGSRTGRSLLSLTWLFAAGSLGPPVEGRAQSQLAPLLACRACPGLGLVLTITNARPDEVYELEYASGMAPPVFWRWYATGALGQTNFLVPADPGTQGFFKARLAADWDSDGVANWQDARPRDPRVGRLTVIITSPTHGTIID